MEKRLLKRGARGKSSNTQAKTKDEGERITSSRPAWTTYWEKRKRKGTAVSGRCETKKFQ
jgi:hypothetical protein